jgi:hypothetical protein
LGKDGTATVLWANLYYCQNKVGTGLRKKAYNKCRERFLQGQLEAVAKNRRRVLVVCLGDIVFHEVIDLLSHMDFDCQLRVLNIEHSGRRKYPMFMRYFKNCDLDQGVRDEVKRAFDRFKRSHSPTFSSLPQVETP